MIFVQLAEINASFERCMTFGKAVEAVLDNSSALDSLIEIRLSDSEIYNNGHGRATVEYVSRAAYRGRIFTFDIWQQ
jgi:hypothetical protein